MKPRIENPAVSTPEVMKALQRIGAATKKSDLPETTLLLVEVRASQINGCSVCLDMHTRELQALDETDTRIHMIAAWREAPYFTDAERAALALTEALTRIADQPDAVSDEIWDEAARHYDEAQLGALVVAIAAINTWNRINAATRQITGDWVAQWITTPESSAVAA
jgi:AhpD family alkylhydroperoxidase